MNDMDQSQSLDQEQLELDPLKRMIAVITQPSQAWQGLAWDRFTWIIPFLLVAIVTATGPLLLPELYSEQQLEMVDNYVDQGIFGEDQAFEMRERIENEGESKTAISVITSLLMAMVGQFIIRALIPAAILLIGVRFIMEGQIRYWSMISLISFTSLPAMIRELVRVPLQMSKNSLDVFFSPAVLTGTDSTAGFALNVLDVFDLWILYLLITGMASVSGITRGRAAGLVIPLWAILCLGMIGIKMSRFGGSM
jgi:Yip1 domain